MKTLTVLSIFVFLTGSCWAYRQLVIFDSTLPVPTVKQVYFQGGFHSPAYSGRNDVVFDPDLTALENKIPIKYWKVTNSVPLEMNVIEKAAVDASQVIVSSGQ